MGLRLWTAAQGGVRTATEANPLALPAPGSAVEVFAETLAGEGEAGYGLGPHYELSADNQATWLASGTTPALGPAPRRRLHLRQTAAPGAPASVTLTHPPAFGPGVPPSQVTGLTIGTVSPGSIPSSWQPATDNVGVTRYRVRRATDSAMTQNVLLLSDTITGLAYVNNAANGNAPVDGTMYWYQAAAGDAAGNWGPWSAAASGMSVNPVIATAGRLMDLRASTGGNAGQTIPVAAGAAWFSASGANNGVTTSNGVTKVGTGAFASPHALRFTQGAAAADQGSFPGAAFPGGAAWTVEAWIRLHSFAVVPGAGRLLRVFGSGTPTEIMGNKLTLLYEDWGDGVPRVLFKVANATATWWNEYIHLVPPSGSLLGAWAHVVMAKGSSLPNPVSYLDGVPAGFPHSDARQTPASLANANPVTFGRGTTTTIGNEADGAVDIAEIRTYDRQLTAAEAVGNYLESRARLFGA